MESIKPDVIAEVKESAKKLKKMVCVYCRACDVNSNGQLRKRNCGPRRYYKDIINFIEEVEREKKKIWNQLKKYK